MKKSKLKKWVKVVLTIILVIICVIVFKHAGVSGALAQTNKNYVSVCFLEWIYLFIVQFMIFIHIWEN